MDEAKESSSFAYIEERIPRRVLIARDVMRDDQRGFRAGYCRGFRTDDTGWLNDVRSMDTPDYIISVSSTKLEYQKFHGRNTIISPPDFPTHAYARGLHLLLLYHRVECVKLTIELQ